MEASAGLTALILDAPVQELPKHLIPALSSLDSQLPVARQIIARLRTEQDDVEGVKLLLNLLSSHVVSHVSLIEELLDVLSTCSAHHGLYIDCIAKFVENPHEASIVLERYRDLVAADRQLIVPVIGSLGEFPLSDAQKRQVLQMTLDAVAIVEGEDVPTIVRVLLASITKDTAKTIVSTIRSKTADVAVQSHAALLLEIIVNALRLRPYAARHFLLQISTASSPLNRLDVLLLIGLIDRAQTKPLVEKAIVATARSGVLTLELLRSTLLNHELILPMLPSVLSLLVCLLHAASTDSTSRILDWTVQLFATFFATYERYSTEALSSLLSAFVSTEDTDSRPSRLAIAAAHVLLSVMTTLPAVLVPYLHLFEEVLYDSAATLHVEILHPLCHLLAALSAFKESGAHHSLQIFVNKALFAGARLQQRAGLVLAAHLLQRAALAPSAAAQLVESVMRVIPAAQSHPVAMLHILDVVLLNASAMPPRLQSAVLSVYLLPLLLKAGGLRGAEQLFRISAGSLPSAGGLEGRREAAFAATHLAKQSIMALSGTAAHSHCLYHSLLLKTCCSLFAVTQPQDAIPLFSRLVDFPMEVGPVCEEVLNADGLSLSGQAMLAERDEAHLADAVWAAFHAFTILVALASLLHERGTQPTVAVVVRVVGYRRCVQATLEALSRRWQANSSSLSPFSAAFHALPAQVDSLLSMPLLAALVAALPLDDLRSVQAAADLTAIAAQRARSALTSPHALIATNFTLASSAVTLCTPLAQELLHYISQLHLLQRLSKHVAQCADIRKDISKAKGTPEESKLRAFYLHHRRLTANELYIVLTCGKQVLVALESTQQGTPQRAQAVSAVVGAAPPGVDVRECLYEACTVALAALEDQGLALLVLHVLVLLTYGFRKARSVGLLCHSMLSRVFSSNEPSVLTDLLPLSLSVPQADSDPLRFRKDLSSSELSSLMVHYCIQREVMMRGDALVSSLCEVAGAAQALLEAGLPTHPRLRALDDVVLPSVVTALVDVASALMERAAPSVASPMPYASFLLALRALTRALRVFLAASKASAPPASVYAQVSSELVHVLPLAQRQLQESVRWRASFPQGLSAALEPRLALAHLAAPFAAANACVRVARQACVALKTPPKGRAPPPSLPRAVLHTETLYCFLEATARTHHIPRADEADDEFSMPAAKADDASDASRSAEQWQAEASEGDGVDGDDSAPTDVPDEALEESDEEEDEQVSDGEFKLVTRKRKVASEAAQNGQRRRERNEEAGDGDEEEAPYTIVVKPKARRLPPAK